jgi:hypothetical protein
MDYFQRAMVADLDEKRARRIGELFEAWAAPSQATPRPVFREPVNRVAHVAGCLLPGREPARYLKMLVSSLRKQGIESTVFTAEWAASWFFNPADAIQSQPVEIDAEVQIASVEGDFLDRAARIAEAIRVSRISIAFFHSSLTEQITARVASMRPAPVQVNVNHGSEMDADVFDGRIHLSENARRRTRFSVPAQWIPPASDIGSRLQMTESVTRQAIGLESASSISATFGDMDKASGSGYLRALSEIMKRFPDHFHLFAGPGSVKAVRSYLHSEGVLPRVRFLGQVADIAPLLGMLDIYLASFPSSSSREVLEAMGAGKPVVAVRFPSDSHYNSAAELVGSSELTAPGEADYIAAADRLLRNPELRAKKGRLLLDRFRAEFHPDRLGERYKAFLSVL